MVKRVGPVVRKPWWALLVLSMVLGAALFGRWRGNVRTGAPFSTGGFTTSATAAPRAVSAGDAASIRAHVLSDAPTNALVDVEVHDRKGAKVFQATFDNQAFAAGAIRDYAITWTPPTAIDAGRYQVEIGVFEAGWGPLKHWNNNSVSLAVSSRPIDGETAIVAPPVVATAAMANEIGAPTATTPPATTNAGGPPPAARATSSSAGVVPLGTTATSAASGSDSAQLSWQGKSWYLHGANLPWLNWGCDFGCGAGGGVSDPSVAAQLQPVFQQAHDSGMHVVRWWVFEGDAKQISRDASGGPGALDPKVYADFDAALGLAEQYDLYFEFTLFSAPTALPSGWLTDPGQRTQLVAALTPLFAHYANNERLLTWDVFNEPDWDIWSKKIDQEPVQATVRAVAGAVHANSHSYVTVGAAMLDGLPMWVGQGLDYYEAHWYDSMSNGQWCAICTNYAEVRGRYSLDKPLIIGEFYAGSEIKPADRFRSWYDKGYAGALAWSLFPNKTDDHMRIDMHGAQTFASQHVDLGPRTGSGSVEASAVSAPPPAPGFSSSASVNAPAGGSAVAIGVSVTSETAISALVDVEAYDAAGKQAFQQVFDNEAFTAGQPRQFTAQWKPPAGSKGDFSVKVGVFTPGWGTLYDWNDKAAQFFFAGR